MTVTEYQNYLKSKCEVNMPKIAQTVTPGEDVYGVVEETARAYDKLIAKEKIDLEKDPIRKERMKFLYNEGVYDFSGI